MTHLYLIDLASQESRQLTKGAFTVGRFDCSPDSTRIAFDQRVNTDPASGGTSDISIVNVAAGVTTPLVTQQGPDANPVWSPDGTEIAFESSMANPSFFYTNTHVAKIRAAGGPIEALSALFDEHASVIRWTTSDIFFSASSRTWSYFFSLDPAPKETTRHSVGEKWIGTSFGLNREEPCLCRERSGELSRGLRAPVSTMRPRS